MTSPQILDSGGTYDFTYATEEVPFRNMPF